MRFALWPNLTQAVGRRSGAPPLDTTGWDGVYIADYSMGDAERFCRNLAILFTAGRRSEVR